MLAYIQISPLTPLGTNSTLFTQCCNTAIEDCQRVCPNCGKNVIGYDEPNTHRRGRIRWRNATRLWKRQSE